MSQPDFSEFLVLLKRLVRNTDRIANAIESGQKTKRSCDPQQREDERVALAVVAIARGASSYQEIANQLGVSRGTVSKNPGIRRAMETAVRDRRPDSIEAAEDYRWNQ